MPASILLLFCAGALAPGLLSGPGLSFRHSTPTIHYLAPSPTSTPSLTTPFSPMYLRVGLQCGSQQQPASGPTQP